jgi:hypothetical protein
MASTALTSTRLTCSELRVALAWADSGYEHIGRTFAPNQPKGQ